MAKLYAMSEVAEHNTSKDCWVTVFGKVYDVSSFLDQHPGGAEIVVAATGKDATAEFDDVGHSHEAWAMLEKYYVGDLDKSTLPASRNPTVSAQGYGKKSKKRQYFLYLIQLLVPIIILNVVAAFFSKPSA